MSVSQDGSPFGFQLAGVNSSLTGATVTGPTGSPPSISVDLGVEPECRRYHPVRPDAARRHQPDHHAASDQRHRRPAPTSSPSARRPQRHRDQFANGADRRREQSRADGAAGGLRHRRRQQFLQLKPAAARRPARRYNASTSLVSGTPANTVFWYTGENGSTPARQTATAQVGPSTTIAYGMRANEQAFSSLARQCGGACGDHLFGERSERAGELSGAEPEGRNQFEPASRARNRSPISRPTSPTRRPPSTTPPS